MAEEKKRKPPLSLQLPEELAEYLRSKAKEGYRSLTAEIVMRLEQSRRGVDAQGAAQ